MALKRIRLELARTPEFPEGNPHCGYEFTAPLTEEGHLDREGWKQNRAACTVRRFWEGQDDEVGQLVHARGHWFFSYEPGEEDDEPIFKFDRHILKQGEYLGITEHDGVTRPFRVVVVAPLVSAPPLR